MIIRTVATMFGRGIRNADRMMLFALVVVLQMLATSAAQTPRMHRLYRADDPPGAIAHRQRSRGAMCDGGCPWVRLRVPQGVVPAVAHDGTFADIDVPTGQVGMPCGQVYRLRLRNIPDLEDVELFPSIELIDRISPPPGMEHRFPIEIAFDEEDLRAAARGVMIVRVVALEDPRFPVMLDRDSTDGQDVFDVAPLEDPLQVADELGRPIAIVRMGAVRPAGDSTDVNFCFGYPAVSIAQLPELAIGPPPWGAPSVRSPAVAVLGTSCPCHGGDPCHGGGLDTESTCWRPRPDEVICDGGDDGPRARISATQMNKGLEPTETAASFRTAAGEVGYAASNRVCVYSPRFFATRKIAPIAQQEVIVQLAGMDAAAPVAEPSVTVRTATARSRLPAHWDIGTKIRHSLQDAQPGLLAENLRYPEESSDQQLPYEGDSRLPFQETDARVRSGTVEAFQPAVEWTRVQAAEVILDDQVAFEQKGIRAANEAVVYEAPTGARLQLCKSVACIEGHTDRVQFTIRFDNVGNETIQDVVINDFLSARLEFIDQSAKSSIPAEIASELHESGARNMQWRIGESLPAGMGGTIQFECRIR